jgi:HAD superfamily hydrolase (TIGR01484 family)
MPKPPPSLILCFDFDGTLVNHESDPQFHPAMADVLREFRRRGAVWVVNTGRSLSQTLAGLAQHHIFLLPDFIIAQECELYRPGFFRAWRDYGSWNSRARKEHANFVSKHEKLLVAVRSHVATHPGAAFLLGNLGEVGVVARDDAQLDEICVLIDELCAREPEVGYHRNGRYLRFSHADYSKGSALRELGRLLNVPSERIFAAGDNYNDLSMLDLNIAGNLACPGNALEPIKQHVRASGGFVANRVASEGMLEALAHFFKAPMPAFPAATVPSTPPV